jgi:hypothetical protein
MAHYLGKSKGMAMFFGRIVEAGDEVIDCVHIIA